MSTFGFQSGLTLKALLENPNLQNPMLNFNDSEKKEDGKESPRIDMGSAFLGPNLWDKTYDLDDFKLEYMDLDEFLSENGLPIVADDGTCSRQSQAGSGNSGSAATSPIPVPSASSSSPIEMQDLSPPQVPNSPQQLPPTCTKPPPLGSPTSNMSNSPVSAYPSPCHKAESEDELESDDAELSDSDVALSTLPGQREFDPRKHRFTDDDLKPQPMIKKSRKIFVPDCAKDERYWARRKKNNVAAKRSRDARRVKENQIAMRASYLERENTAIKEEVEKLRRENIRLKAALSKYEKQP